MAKKKGFRLPKSERNLLNVLLIIVVIVAVIYFAWQKISADKLVTGNGAPSGTHYNLEVIGVPKAKTAAITTGHRIFVPLEGTCKINLSMGEFSVLDGNCSDNSPAVFQLPNPDTDGDGVTAYTVWAKTLGKPGGKATATTCATDPVTLEQVCSVESSVFIRTKGKSTFSNVTKGFLYVSVDLNGDGTIENIPIFDDRLQDYFWNYDNNGLKHLQLRFYPNQL